MSQKIRNLLSLISILLLTSICSSAQNNIKGKIVDKTSKEALVGVAVYIEGTTIGTTSESDGTYQITTPKNKCKVTYSYLGYESMTININSRKSNKEINIELSTSSEKLSDITVTAKSKARRIRERAMPISVIRMQEIQGTVSDVSDILSKTTGVKIRSTGGEGSSSRISVRGLEGKRIGFFLDGTPMNDNSDFLDINDIPTDMIERIEIYKGIVPAKFGGSSIGGAINIVLKEYPPQYIDMSYSLKSFNTHKTNAAFKSNNSEKGFEYGIGGWYTYSDNDYMMKLPLQTNKCVRRNHDRFEKKVIGGGFSAKKWWFDKVKTEVAIILTDREIQGVEQNIQEAESKAEATALEINMEKNDFFLDGLDLDAVSSIGYSVFYFKDKAMNRYDWSGEKRAPVTKFGGEIGMEPNDSKNRKFIASQKTNFNYIIDKKNSLNLNSAYNYAHNNPQDFLKDQSIGYQTNHKSTMNSWVAGLSHEFQNLSQKFTNSLSIKYYYYAMNTKLVNMYHTSEAKTVDLQKNDFGFNNAMRFRFTPEFLIKASFAYDLRLPSENELLGDGFIVAPSGNLEPEKNKSINIGMMFDKSYQTYKRIQLEVNIFYMQLENMIRFTGGPLQSVYQNFGEMRTLGIEGEVKWDATDFLYIFGNITYQDLRDTREFEPNSKVENATKDDRIPNIPYFFANSGFELHKNNIFGGKGQNTRFFSDISFVKEYLYDFEQSINQKRRIPSSITINLGLEHSFKDGNFILGLQANNISDAALVSEFNRPLPGRNYGMKIRYIIK